MRRLQFKFPSQIRISGWDFGSSARAMNQAGGNISTQAELGKRLNSTTERKKMSSTIKRVALVAVAALGLGTLTSISANAALIADSFTTSGSAATASSTGTVNTAVTLDLIYSGISAGSAETATVSGTVQSSPLTSSATAVTFADTASATQVNSSFSSPTVTATAAGRATRYITASFTPDKTGTYVIKLASAGAANNAYVTWTITVNAVGSPTAADSVSVIKTGNSWSAGSSATTDDTVTVSKATSANEVAVIKVITKNAAGTDLTTTTALTATISGPGTLSAGSVVTGGTAPVGRAVTGAAGDNYISVWSDGVAGVSTITISSGTTVLATETVTFYGSLATLTANVKKIVANSGSATSAALEVVGKDSAGIVVPSQSLTITSGTTATIASGSATSSSASEAAAGTASIALTGLSGTYGSVVLTIADAATGLVSTTATVKVAATEAAAVTATLDNSSYAPGEKVTLTIAGKDANGLAVANVSTGSAVSLTTNMAVQGLTTVQDATFADGSFNIVFYAPVSSGEFSVVVTLVSSSAWSTALDGTTVTTKAVVVSSTDSAVDAANEATDAANAATDAANAAAEAADAATAAAQDAQAAAMDAQAAVAALATSVASLIAGIKAQITTLTNLVIKIQKKVKA